MITVSPEKDKNLTEQLYGRLGVPFGEKSECVIARSGEDILGFCLFSVTGDEVTVHAVSPKEDILMADGVLRSALHVASGRFIFKARYDNKEFEDLFEKIGFIKDKKEKTLDIDKLFRGCGCEEK